MYSVAFTGHRPDKLGGYKPSALQDAIRAAIREKLVSVVFDHGEPEVISGMAMGVDQWAAQEALALEIPVTAAIPFEGQHLTWPAEAQIEYRKLLARCKQHVVSPTWRPVLSRNLHHELNQVMQVRNQWMVNHCNLLIAIYNGDETGGTAKCVAYAKRVLRPDQIFYINPKDLLT